MTRIRPQRAAKRQTTSSLRILLTLMLVVSALYLAKTVLVPLSLAVLFTFVLTPLVMTVQRWGLSRVPAVLLVVGLTLGVSGAIGWGVGAQLSKLANNLPKAEQINAKIARLRGVGTGPFAKLTDMVQQMGKTPAPATPASENAAPAQVAPETDDITAPPKPQVLIAHTEEGSALSQTITVAEAILEPLAEAGLIVILVLFMLIRREDLRNRVISLLGHGRLTGTTRVLVGSAERLSKYLLMQLSVNAVFGFIFGVALLIIGVPYWFLWGFLTVLLRFVPYVGSWMAAALPVILSFAISPGFAQPIMVLAVFFTLDLVSANVLEPMLFGHSTGVSPVALLVAALFWTWVWGPIGLVLSTPLTVCLVVLGQHVPRLRFLSLLLGDQPALAIHASYYQRLLAGDKVEAAQLVTRYVASKGRETLPDDVLIPALTMARRDRRDAGLTAEDESALFDATAEIIARSRPAAAVPPPVVGQPPLVLAYPAHHRTEELVLQMLTEVVEPKGLAVQAFSTKTLPSEIEAAIERDRPAMLLVAIVPPGGITQARYLCRRLRKRFADLPIVIGYFGKVRDFDKLLVRFRAAGASYVTTSVAQSQTQLLALLPKPGAATNNIAPASALPAIAAAGA